MLTLGFDIQLAAIFKNLILKKLDHHYFYFQFSSDPHLDSAHALQTGNGSGPKAAVYLYSRLLQLSKIWWKSVHGGFLGIQVKYWLYYVFYLYCAGSTGLTRLILSLPT